MELWVAMNMSFWFLFAIDIICHFDTGFLSLLAVVRPVELGVVREVARKYEASEGPIDENEAPMEGIRKRCVCIRCTSTLLWTNFFFFIAMPMLVWMCA